MMLEKYEIVRDMFRPDMKGGFDYRPALAADATPQQRLGVMAGAMDWVLAMQQEAGSARRQATEAKKRAHQRYADAVLALSKAFALGGSERRPLETFATRSDSSRASVRL